MIEYKVYEPPKNTFQWFISDGVCIQCTGKVPNRFHRWTMKLVFGWRMVVLP